MWTVHRNCIIPNALRSAMIHNPHAEVPVFIRSTQSIDSYCWSEHNNKNMPCGFCGKCAEQQTGAILFAFDSCHSSDAKYIACAECMNIEYWKEENKLKVRSSYAKSSKTRENGNLATQMKKRTYRSRAHKILLLFLLVYAPITYSPIPIIILDWHFPGSHSNFSFSFVYSVRRSHGLSVASVCLLWFQYNYVFSFFSPIQLHEWDFDAIRCPLWPPAQHSFFFSWSIHPASVTRIAVTQMHRDTCNGARGSRFTITILIRDSQKFCAYSN